MLLVLMEKATDTVCLTVGSSLYSKLHIALRLSFRDRLKIGSK